MDAVAPAAALWQIALVLENEPIARHTFRLRLAAPAIARTIQPGQFVMIRPGPEGASDPLLGRPLALFDVARDPAGLAVALDVVYLVVGRGTSSMSTRRPGERLAVWGPLGNGFGPAPAGAVVFVAGGIGQTPFLALARAWLGHAAYGAEPTGDPPPVHPRARAQPAVDSVTLLYGTRTAALLAGVDDFARAGVNVEVATDDGTAGHHGLVTDLLTQRLERGERPAKVVACGPTPMLAAVARIATAHRIPCDVSLENPMACGFGACFSCVAPLLQHDGSTDLRRLCVEGPVVPAERVDWNQMVH